MSIIIKANQLNLLIYKYFLESGLEHSAFTFFNQAHLEETAKEYKFNVKAGHLLGLLEKALIFNQIQAHMNFSEYMECNEPFHLLKSHTCAITEKVVKDKEKFMEQLNNNIYDSIRRTNTIYHTALANDQFEQIIYEPRGNNYFDKFFKVKLNREKNQDNNARIIVHGEENGLVGIYDEESDGLSVYRIQDNGSLQIQAIYPCIAENKLSKLLEFAICATYIIEIYQNNLISIKNIYDENSFDISIQKPQIKCIKIPQSIIQNQINHLSFNQTYPFLLTLSNQEQYCVINLKNMRLVAYGKGIFRWRIYNQYIVYDINKRTLQLRKFLQQEEPIIKFSLFQSLKQEQTSLVVDSISINSSKTYMSVLLKCPQSQQNNIYIYTFDRQQALYKFNKTECINKIMWVNSKDVEYLVYLTKDPNTIKIFEVELNAFSKIIQIKDYQQANGSIEIVDFLTIIKKDQYSQYIIAKGQQNLFVIDISMSKIQRIQLPQSGVNGMSEINGNYVALWNDNCLFTLKGNLLEPLFQ